MLRPQPLLDAIASIKLLVLLLRKLIQNQIDLLTCML